MSNETYFHTLIIGGGQAGLAAGYYLAQQKQKFTILEAGLSTGASWRNRWDSLRLFTPSQYDGLPGLPFSTTPFYFPTKDEVADYLAQYAQHFHLPIQYGVRVRSLTQAGDGFFVESDTISFSAQNVIVATGPYQKPYVPPYASELKPTTLQIHSHAYRNPKQLPVEKVLIVGAGNSGAEIALELATMGKQVWLAGRDVGHIPANTLGRVLGGRPYWWFISYVLSEDTFIGRKMKAQVLYHGNPLIRTNRREVAAAGVLSTPRVADVINGNPQLEDGRILPVEAVVWATGYRPDFSWIKLPIFDAHGLPQQQRGFVPGTPNLYFVGLHFLRGLTSSLLGGVGRDAEHIVKQIVSVPGETVPQ